MLFPVVQVNDTLKESFKEFQQNPLNNFKVNVRRTRAAQLRQLLSSPEAIDLQTFQDEVWNIENKTHLQSRDIDLRIFEAPTMFAPSIEQLLNQEKVTLLELEIALASGDLELHGNYVWIQGAHLYAPRIKDEQQKLINIRTALQTLNNPSLTPIQKALQIDAVHGFGENNATGLVMLFNPDAFALTNPVSKGELKKLGVNLTSSTSLDMIQYELHSLKEALGASDFLELDWFLYLCSQGEYSLGVVDSEKDDGAKGTWFVGIKKVLEDSGEPLHVSEITAKALVNGMQTRGKTPERTVSKILTTNPQVFERVTDGVYSLRQQATQRISPQVASMAKEYTEPPFDQICRSLLAQGLRLDEQTLRRYYLALKTRGFVILSGISGTGKTWLAEAYADTVGAEYLLVSVAPNWTTNEDLLGYTDPLTERLYHHTAFSYFLEAAAQEYEQAQNEGRTAKPYHLILDEMNLARLEYYFARFLSAMEVRARYGVAPIDLGAQKIVNLFPNLFFIGTINVDETTHGFADKIYDRAQLIELTAPRDALAAYIAGEPYCDLVMSVWDAVHEVAPFAFRVLEEIKVYINAARDLGQNWEVALDEQILQKTLPKCKGADLRVGEALMKLKAILPAETFPLSHAKVQRMIEGFQKYGFASYF